MKFKRVQAVFSNSIAKDQLITYRSKWVAPPEGEKIRLNLGCGDKLIEGYINVDVATSRKGVAPDVLADLRSLPFGSNYADEILAVHVIEHFYLWEAEDVLNHWKNCLRRGGQIILECPNLLTAAQQLIENPNLAVPDGKEGQLVMWPMYGDPGWRDPLMCHKWGYTPDSLSQLLSKVGFQQVRQEPSLFKKRDPRDMRIVGNN